MTIEQIRVGADNFSYLIYDKKGGIGALVDPGFDADRALGRIEELGLDLKFVIATHYHGDHVHDVPEVVRRTGARTVWSSAGVVSGFGRADVDVKDGGGLSVGHLGLKFLETPGHTPDSICIVVDDQYLLTGDTIFIGDCGRCDLPGGSFKDMFNSIRRIKELDDDLIIYPGHDYGPVPFRRLGEEKKKSRVMLAKDLEGFSRV
ncbi:MAG: MBL fold metallo-hydrolase [Candidatus Thermoplasmatota archaeon]|nr:MBL fold metallo-hydrolase [Candidatus Thermoplasmatota archaeon]